MLQDDFLAPVIPSRQLQSRGELYYKTTFWHHLFWVGSFRVITNTIRRLLGTSYSELTESLRILLDGSLALIIDDNNFLLMINICTHFVAFYLKIRRKRCWCRHMLWWLWSRIGQFHIFHNIEIVDITQ